jgi:hypothetical protein
VVVVIAVADVVVAVAVADTADTAAAVAAAAVILKSIEAGAKVFHVETAKRRMVTCYQQPIDGCGVYIIGVQKGKQKYKPQKSVEKEE